MKRIALIVYLILVGIIPLSIKSAEEKGGLGPEKKPIFITKEILDILPNIRHLTFSKTGRAFALTSTNTKDTVFTFNTTNNRWDELFTRPQKNYIKTIHAITSTDLFIVNENILLYWDMIHNQHPIGFSKENFNLTPSDMLLNVTGNSFNQLWITYKTANNTIKSRFFRISNGKIQVKTESFDYKSITVGYDGITWLLDNTGTIFNISSIDIEENINETDFFPKIVLKKSSIPLISIYAHDKNHLWALDTNGMLYQFKEEKFIPVDTPFFSMPKLDYIQLTSSRNGPLYCVHQDGRVYVLPLDYTAEKYPEAVPKPPIKKEEAQPAEPSLERQEPSVEKPEIPIQQKTRAQQIAESYARAQARLSYIPKRQTQPQRTFTQIEPTIPLSVQRELQTTTQAQTTPQPESWEQLEKEFKNPVFEFGFNTGLIEGLQKNPAYGDIIEDLRTFYNKGISEGPKTCILDTVASQVQDMLKQEGQQALQSIQGTLLKDFLGQKVR